MLTIWDLYDPDPREKRLNQIISALEAAEKRGREEVLGPMFGK